MFCITDSLCFKTENALLLFISILVILYLIHNTSKQYRNVLRDEVSTKQTKVSSLQNKLLSLEKRLNVLGEQNIALGEKAIYEERITDPLIPPLQTYESKYTMKSPPGVLVNIPTRGYVPNYQQIGVIQPDGGGGGSGGGSGGGNNNLNNILPLYGKPTYPGSQQWLYYTNTNGFNPIKLPIIKDGKNCLDDYGCKQIYDSGEQIKVQGGGNYKVGTLYKYDTPRYIPFV